jgi:hypothetical protein
MDSLRRVLQRGFEPLSRERAQKKREPSIDIGVHGSHRYATALIGSSSNPYFCSRV